MPELMFCKEVLKDSKIEKKKRDPALRHGHGAQKIKLSAASTTDDDDPVSLEG